MTANLIHYGTTPLAETSLVKTAQASLGRLRINKKQLVIDAILWGALAALIVLGYANLNGLLRYPRVSLRFDSPISGKAAYQARQYSIEHSEEETFWLTFWHETTARVKGDFNSADATCIIFSGDAALVWPARYLTGIVPGVADGLGCSVSSMLAWELWGGNDVVGKEIEIDGEKHLVRGVFEGDDLLALVSVRDEDTSQSFTAAELTRGPTSPTRSEALTFASSAGLGRPKSALIDTPTLLASLLAVAPLVILAFYALILCVGYLKVYPNALRGGMLLALIAFAMLLPSFLDKLPDWIIPTRWSDFSFWSGIASQIGDDLREYLLLSPKLRDVAYKTLIIKQAVIAFPAAGCAMAACFRSYGKKNKLTAGDK
ncbi:MAG: hypothetical protein FWH57_09480 [Oscillospiraceae bacterium]|nr:hypothetical protein [Oscillospiraceae bacterium]